jgi:lipopolysaccharide export system protein LptA
MIARILIASLIIIVVALPAAAQTRTKPRDTGTPNAMQGFYKNKGQPVAIEAEKLEVREKDKVAVFSGKVVVTQGDTTMRCKTLTVFYVGPPEKGAAAKSATKPAANPASKPAATIGPSGDQKIKKLEAKGDVVVTQKDQIATGDAALFDMETNVVTMSGNVVLTQGQNVLRGNRLVVDMTTGYSRVESAAGIAAAASTRIRSARAIMAASRRVAAA